MSGGGQSCVGELAGVGVYDSGVGGLSVLRALRAAAPNQSFVYLGDNANAPYGVRSADEVVDLTRMGVERLYERGCRLVVVACNTASALALRPLQREWLPTAWPDRRLLGVFVPIVEAIAARGWREAVGDAAEAATERSVVFFATPATVASGAFAREAAARAPGIRVRSVACDGLVEAIEAADWPAADAIAAAAAARADAEPSGGPRCVVLGCTHYPLVEGAFRRAAPTDARFFDQPTIVAASLARWLERHPGFEDRAGRLELLTTGAPERATRAAERLFGAGAAFAPAEA